MLAGPWRPVTGGKVVGGVFEELRDRCLLVSHVDEAVVLDREVSMGVDGRDPGIDCPAVISRRGVLGVGRYGEDVVHVALRCLVPGVGSGVPRHHVRGQGEDERVPGVFFGARVALDAALGHSVDKAIGLVFDHACCGQLEISIQFAPRSPRSHTRRTSPHG